jgi:hypothetical protein
MEGLGESRGLFLCQGVVLIHDLTEAIYLDRWRR